MPAWLGYLLALVALVVLAPLIGWLGHRHGRSIKGGMALASLMLGVGVIDPPAKQAIEANERRVAKGDENGEPPDPEV